MYSIIGIEILVFPVSIVYKRSSFLTIAGALGKSFKLAAAWLEHSSYMQVADKVAVRDWLRLFETLKLFCSDLPYRAKVHGAQLKS